MRRTLRVPLLVLSLLVLGVAATSPVGVVADEEVASAPPQGQWLYDLRVVKVVGDMALAEKPAPWAEGAGGRPIVDTAWPVLRQALQERGATTLLMDQRVTTVPYVPAQLKQSRAEAMEIFDRRDKSNEFWKSSVRNDGCDGKLMPGSELDYEVLVQWSLSRPDSEMPVQHTSAWRGRALHFPGSTLVLSHRQQDGVGGAEPVTVEIWAFLTARWLPRR